MNEVLNNMSLKDFIPLISALVIVVGWVATYYFNLRIKMREAFITKTEENIKSILGPMSVEIREIWQENHKQIQERKMQTFYDKYRAFNSPLHLSASSLVVEHFKHFQDHFQEFKQNRTAEQHDYVFTALGILERTVDSKLKHYRKVLFKYYDWYYQREKLNPLIRVFTEILRVIHQSLTGLAQISSGLIVITLFEFLAYKFYGIFNVEFPMLLWPNRGYILSISVLVILSWLVSFGIALGMGYFSRESAGSAKYSKQQIVYNKKINSFPIFHEQKISETIDSFADSKK